MYSKQKNQLEVAGSSPALVNFSLFIQNLYKICTQSVSLVVHYMITNQLVSVSMNLGPGGYSNAANRARNFFFF